MDMAAISLGLCAAVLIIALLVQFFLWLKVRFELKAFVLEWKGVIENAVEKVDEYAQTIAALREKQAQLEAGHTAQTLKQTALEESFAHFNAKTVARAREEAKSARKEARSAEADAEARPAAGSAEALAAALAEQTSILDAEGSGQASAAGRAPKLRVKRFGT